MKNFITIALVTTTLAIVGCSNDSAPTPSAEAITEAAPLPVQSAEADTLITTEGENKLISATHRKTSCETGVPAKISWDISSIPDSSAVEVFVYRGNDSESLFSAGGATGEAETGPWVYSGTTFALYDAEKKQQLDKLVIPGSDCLPQN